MRVRKLVPGLAAAVIALGSGAASAQSTPARGEEPATEVSATATPRPRRRSRLRLEQPHAAEGQVRVAVNRPHTTVFLDDVRVGTAPFERNIPIGMHTVRLESPGHKPWQGTLTVEEGSLTRVRGRLRPSVNRSS